MTDVGFWGRALVGFVCAVASFACGGSGSTQGGPGVGGQGGSSSGGAGAIGSGGLAGTGTGGFGTGGLGSGGLGSGGLGSGGAGMGGNGGGSSGGPSSDKLLDAIDLTSFALDAGFVYFTAVDPDAFPATGYGVFRVAKTGGAAQALAKHTNKTQAVSVDATHAYYVTHDTAKEIATLHRVGLGGGTSEPLDTIQYIPIEGPGSESIVAGDWVYWAGTTELRRYERKTGALASLGSGGRHALAVDATHVYSLFSGGFAPAGTVMRTPLGTNAYEVLAELLPRPMDFAIDETSIYLVMLGKTTQQTDGSLVAIPKQGGAPKTLVPNMSGMLTIAVDDTDVYFGADDATIRRVSKSGGSAQVVAAAKTLPRGLALDATHAYWHGQSSIHRAPR